MKRKFSRVQNFAKSQPSERGQGKRRKGLQLEVVEHGGKEPEEKEQNMIDVGDQSNNEQPNQSDTEIVYRVTFRNFQSSQPLIDYIKKRFTPILRRFFDRELIVHVTLKKTNLCIGEISAHLPHFTLVASTEEKDFYKLIDKLKDIVREQLRRHKEKLADY